LFLKILCAKLLILFYISGFQPSNNGYVHDTQGLALGWVMTGLQPFAIFRTRPGFALGRGMMDLQPCPIFRTRLRDALGRVIGGFSSADRWFSPFQRAALVFGCIENIFFSTSN